MSEEQDINANSSLENKALNVGSFFICFILGFIVCAMFFGPFAIHVLKDNVIFDTNSLTSVDEKLLLTLIRDGKIHTADFAIERIIEFYQTLLAVVVSLGGFGGLLGFLYIRQSHSRDITEGIRTEVNSSYSRCIFKEELDTLLKKEKTEGDIGIQLEKITDLEQRIRNLENIQEEYVLERPETDVLTHN